MDISCTHRIRRLFSKFRLLGFRHALRNVISFFKPKTKQAFPLAGADPDLILARDVSAIRDFARRKSKLGQTQSAAENIGDFFPFEFVSAEGQMRYAFFPALERSKGLVVIFHGYLGFEIYPLRYGWRDFDLLLPLDNFGRKNLGSWFWGERGDNYVERIVWGLIQKIRSETKAKQWFTIGASMGGFAALYHAIKYSADGIYVMTPVIDLKTKIPGYWARNIETPYTHVTTQEDKELKLVPDIYREARQMDTLPPLFLVQNQYDRSNVFGKDTLPLLEIYYEKKGWSGLRVHPSIGHQGHDGSYAEAQYFFSLILKKSPPRRVDFYDQD